MLLWFCTYLCTLLSKVWLCPSYFILFFFVQLFVTLFGKMISLDRKRWVLWRCSYYNSWAFERMTLPFLSWVWPCGLDAPNFGSRQALGCVSDPLEQFQSSEIILVSLPFLNAIATDIQTQNNTAVEIRRINILDIRLFFFVIC